MTHPKKHTRQNMTNVENMTAPGEVALDLETAIVGGHAPEAANAEDRHEIIETGTAVAAALGPMSMPARLSRTGTMKTRRVASAVSQI